MEDKTIMEADRTSFDSNSICLLSAFRKFEAKEIPTHKFPIDLRFISQVPGGRRRGQRASEKSKQKKETFSYSVTNDQPLDWPAIDAELTKLNMQLEHKFSALTLEAYNLLPESVQTLDPKCGSTNN